jgi:hypothetical protein
MGSMGGSLTPGESRAGGRDDSGDAAHSAAPLQSGAPSQRVRVNWPGLTFDHPERLGDRLVYADMRASEWQDALRRRGWDWTVTTGLLP